MLKEICQFVEEIYKLISDEGTLFYGPINVLPPNGIYLFFEKGQKILMGNREFDRVVRIGINEKPNNFGKRIREHYRGNIKGSVFRENIGWALLERYGYEPKNLYKTKANYKKQCSGGPLETLISKYFSEALTFKAFAIQYEKLVEYEKILTMTFSIRYQYKIWRGELDIKNWLGLYSYSRRDKIKKSGLWNCENVILINNFETLMKLNGLSIHSFEKVLRELSQKIVCL
jgi:hypothetical protein